MTFSEKIEQAINYYSKMQKRYPDVKWGPEHFMLNLVEEVGELSNALMCELGIKFKNRQKSEIEDAFFDVLFNLLLLSSLLKIDLDRAWKKGLEEFEEKLDSGEFDPR